MFQFRRFPTYYYFIHSTLPEYGSGGFPHSDISGSQLMCSSPKLFAACHVLHRLLMPRHSPCALFSLTYSWFSLLTWELCSLEIVFLPLLKKTKSFISTISSLHVCFRKRSVTLASSPCSVFKVQIENTNVPSKLNNEREEDRKDWP